MNSSTGKVVHEISSTGAVYYGDNTEPGDINETAQFDIAAGLVWQWSGDQAFLHQNYAFIKAGLHYLTGLDGGNGPWPAGAGIVENTALGNEAVDVSSETVQALGVLHEMALAMGDHSTAAWAARHRQAMLKAFHQWWISSQNLYADSMCDGTEGDCTYAGQQLQQRWWTTVAPMPLPKRTCCTVDGSNTPSRSVTCEPTAATSGCRLRSACTRTLNSPSIA